MAVINVPSYIGFDSATLTLMRATQESRSPFTGRRQVVTSPFALWQFDGNIVPLQGAEAGAVRSFLAQLKGRANTFRLFVPGVTTPMSGYNGSTGVVDGSGQQGSSLTTRGWTPNKLLLKAGDYFNIGDELKLASFDILSDGNGKATLYFEPECRTLSTDGQEIWTVNPYLYLAAQEDDIAKWSLKDFNTHNMKITAIEAFQ